MKLEERHYAETAREYARRMLKENIISMDLKPGAMVSENELAAQLGLSRTPVREALMDMSQYGVVDVMPQRGSRISLIDYNLGKRRGLPGKCWKWPSCPSSAKMPCPLRLRSFGRMYAFSSFHRNRR